MDNSDEKKREQKTHTQSERKRERKRKNETQSLINNHTHLCNPNQSLMPHSCSNVYRFCAIISVAQIISLVHIYRTTLSTAVQTIIARNLGAARDEKQTTTHLRFPMPTLLSSSPPLWRYSLRIWIVTQQTIYEFIIKIVQKLTFDSIMI